MKAGLLTLFIIAILNVSASYAGDKWHEGVVVLKDNTVMVGEILYNSAFDIVRIRQDGKILSYSAFQVANFNYHDTEMEAVRRYVPLPSNSQAGRYKDVFYEVIMEDNVSLLRKKSIYPSAKKEEAISGGQKDIYSEHRSDYDYYFLYDGKLVASNRFRRDLKPLLNKSCDGKITEYIRTNALNTTKTYDQIRVVRYFNHMMNDRNDRFLTSF